jgi:hypothetical protein
MNKRYEVWQSGERVASMEGGRALPEAMHYAMQYGQDGIATVYKIAGKRKTFCASVLVKKGRERNGAHDIRTGSEKRSSVFRQSSDDEPVRGKGC